MASNFHQPKALMAVWSTLKLSRVVAPPEQRLYALIQLLRGDVGDVLDSGSGGSEFMCDFGGGDVAGSVLAVEIGVEWSFGRGSMVSKVEGMMLASTDGAEDGVPGEPMSECFPMAAFFWSV